MASSSFLLSILTMFNSILTLLQAVVMLVCVLWLQGTVFLPGALRSQWTWEGEGKFWILEEQHTNSGWRDREGVTSVGAGRESGHFFKV